MSNKPFIKKFQHEGFYYVYDVNTDLVVELEEKEYELLDDCVIRKNQKLQLLNDSRFANDPEAKQILDGMNAALREKALFSNFRPNLVSMAINKPEEVRNNISGGVSQFVLDLTGQCNLRCGYCDVSGKYASHDPKNVLEMDFVMMEKVVDFILRHTSVSKPPYVSFYGGEPLLKFDLIRKAMEELLKKSGPKQFNFNLTTNGTLLDKSKIDFLIEHDVRLLVSLDGPIAVNDRYRRFQDQRGTFKTIMKNLEFLKDYDPDFFSRQVSISCVIAPPFDQLNDVSHFFASTPIFKEFSIGNRITARFASTSGTSFAEDYHLNSDAINIRPIVDRFHQRVKEAILNRDLNSLTIEKSSLFNILGTLATRPERKLRDFAMPSGTCYMGSGRVFIRPNGDLLICERANSDLFKIGTIDSGYDYKKIAGFYQKLEKVLYDCKHCWALSHCDHCWLLLGNLDELNNTKKEKFCAAQRNNFETVLKLYVELLKKDPDSLQVFGRNH